MSGAVNPQPISQKTDLAQKLNQLIIYNSEDTPHFLTKINRKIERRFSSSAREESTTNSAFFETQKEAYFHKARRSSRGYSQRESNSEFPQNSPGKLVDSMSNLRETYKKIEKDVFESRKFNLSRIESRYPNTKGRIKTWTPETVSQSQSQFDFGITLGGDGTLLYASWLFQNNVPLIVPFQLGSLGFLATFDIKNAKKILKSAINNGTFVSFRTRFNISVYRLNKGSSSRNDKVKFSLNNSGDTSESSTFFSTNEQSNDQMSYKDSGDVFKISNSLPYDRFFDQSKTLKESSSSSAEKLERSYSHSSYSHSSRKNRVLRKIVNESKSHTRTSSVEKTVASFPGNGFMPTRNRSISRKTFEINGDESDYFTADAFSQIGQQSYTKESSFRVLNEVVVDRGLNPFLTALELYVFSDHLTTVQADGLVLSTPTGSTAYSLAAGGSLVHPDIPAILITPVCPHSLSFRPMLVPDSKILKVQVPFDSRNTAMVSFDGRNRIELQRGDYIQVEASEYPFPVMSHSCEMSLDWFEGVQRSLNWNVRKRQKNFSVLEVFGENKCGVSDEEYADDEQ
ncbi:hypothetical protein BB560_004047 [Smittium megazygosporum]|uniref:NAD+ kinase n=1 Tax=Smittium megazygosporum TaxID=133381 RepID=A0A2T9ZAD1_9FUNG|nr:hypothetical protein BB560_004047 [Smittium megazygosporum]